MRLIDADVLFDQASDIEPQRKSDYLLIGRFMEMIIKAETIEPNHGEWIDFSDDGYVECPFCGSATNCEYGGKEDLHYCFSCGARMKGGEEK